VALCVFLFDDFLLFFFDLCDVLLFSAIPRFFPCALYPLIACANLRTLAAGRGEERVTTSPVDEV